MNLHRSIVSGAARLTHSAASLAALMLLAAASAAHAQNAFVNWESAHVSPLAISADGNRLVAVNTADHRLEIFGLDAQGVPLPQRSVPVGLEPVSVRLRTATEAWVVNRISDSISVVDISGGRVLYTLDTGDAPADVVFAGNPERAWVSLSTRNQLQVFDAQSPQAGSSVLALAGEEPRALARSPDGRFVYVAFFESGNGSTAVPIASVSDPTGPYAGQNPPPNSGNAFDPPRAGGQGPAPRVAQIVRKNAAGDWLDGNGRDWSSFVTWDVLDNDLAIVDTVDGTIDYVPRLMSMLMAVGVGSDGRIATVGTELRNEIRFEPNARSIFVQVRMASWNPAQPGNVSRPDLNPQLDYSVRQLPQATRELAIGDPRGVIVHTARGEVLVSGMGSDNLIVSSIDGARLATIALGRGPTGLALSPDGSRVYALNRFDASISTVEIATRSELARVDFFDPTPAEISEGRALLYDTHASSGLGQAACGSCHVDARSDGLAWDLGNPAGLTETVDEPCRPGVTCGSWHSMKGPLLTQSLQGIVGNGPMHWRGDRHDLSEFAAAFVNLQGDDVQPDLAAMLRLQTFIASVAYPPNPNRNRDGSYPTSLALTTGSGNPASGENLFVNAPSLGGNLACADCHALPTGTDGLIDMPPGRQPTKDAQLRGLWERVGMSFTSQANTRGFGFMSDSRHDSLASRLGPPFNFGPPAQAAQRIRDVEAFMLAMETETPAVVGRMLELDGPASGEDLELLESLIAQADSGRVGLIARSHAEGAADGYTYGTAGIWFSAQENAPRQTSGLLALASADLRVVIMAVPTLSQFRIGVDRDADGVFDGDERAHGSDPADSTSLPLSFCRTDFDGDGLLDADDLAGFTEAHTAGSPRANWNRSFGPAGLPTVTEADLDAYELAYAQGCAVGSDRILVDGFDP